MKWLGIFLLVMVILPSCEEEVTEVSFMIKAEGFNLHDGLLDTAEAFPSFSHRVSGGLVTFHEANNTYEFDLEDTGLEDFQFRLPVGIYQLDIIVPPASLYGQQGGAFTSDPAQITITELTDNFTVQVKANCALFLVYDEMNHLDDGIYMIERHLYPHGYFKSYPLSLDSISGLYYTYFTPDTVPSDPSAFLWFYNGKPGIEEGGLSTAGFEVGYQYYIRILE